jgi:hypothetical protein
VFGQLLKATRRVPSLNSKREGGRIEEGEEETARVRGERWGAERDVPNAKVAMHIMSLRDEIKG